MDLVLSECGVAAVVLVTVLPLWPLVPSVRVPAPILVPLLLPLLLLSFMPCRIPPGFGSPTWGLGALFRGWACRSDDASPKDEVFLCGSDDDEYDPL